MNNIERMMQEDIKTMKRIGRNIKHQKGKRGLGTGNFNPLRGMSQREIAKKHGKVKVYDMTKILTKEEFKQLDDSMKKLHMDSWRMRFTNDEIIKGMGVSPATFYKTCNKLGVVMDRRSNNKPPKAKKESKKDTVTTVEAVKAEAVKAVPTTTPTPQVVEPTKPTTPEPKTIISLDGAYKGSDLHNKLQGLAMFLNDETEYIIKIEVKQ